ncbi:MAG: COX15/CtaA family protein [Balneolaceae bacterium]
MTLKDRKHVRIWYWSGAVLVFLILIIGGITRLTGSGLSMTDWKPIMGAIPPVTEAQWDDAFDQYKAYPEYQQLNRGMSLQEFKFIFFWEYLHRMLGRAIGLVFLIPFGWFLIKKKLDKRQTKRAVVLLILGLSQGLMGWYMVQSGLVDVPRVSHFRLAAHLSLAFLIFGCCVWFALDLKQRTEHTNRDLGEIRIWLWAFLLLLSLQIVWGAFVAGLNAGHIYNTFPKMHQYWMPPELWLMEPLMSNVIENMVTVQWIHRVLATLLLLLAAIIWVRSYRMNTSLRTKMWVMALFSILLLQYALGVFTLIWHVPVSLGVLHQAVAMILLGIAIGALHHCKAKPQIAVS